MGRFTPGPPKDPEFLGLSELKERGWSATMIENLLGEPDKRVKNPRYRKASPMRFYSTSRVDSVESSAPFADRKKKAAKRSAAGTASANDRIQALLEAIESMAITLEYVRETDLMKMAWQKWEERNARGVAERRDPRREGLDRFEKRVAVNFVRHNLTTYDTALDETAARVGATAARERIRQKIYKAIENAYPTLHDECVRQMKRRGVETDVSASELLVEVV